MKRDFARYYLILLATLFFVGIMNSLAMVNNTLITSQTPIDTSLPTFDLRVFPRELICDEIILGDGPTWSSIEIGNSTVADLQHLFNPNANYELFVGATGQIYFSGFEGEMNETPYILVFCEKEGVISGLQILFTSIYNPLNFRDFIIDYGLPDTVTWSSNPPSVSVAFWFEQGVAIEVIADTNDTLQLDMEDEFFGGVVSITYFPYQTNMGYETRYPYLFTYRPPYEIPGCCRIGTQNPFDFEAILGTITAQPTRTQTTTPSPITSVETLTPTASRTPSG